jgi:hypothetical protein
MSAIEVEDKLVKRNISVYIRNSQLGLLQLLYQGNSICRLHQLQALAEL